MTKHCFFQTRSGTTASSIVDRYGGPTTEASSGRLGETLDRLESLAEELSTYQTGFWTLLGIAGSVVGWVVYKFRALYRLCSALK